MECQANSCLCTRYREVLYLHIYLSFIALCIVNGVEYILQKELNSGLTKDIEEGRFCVTSGHFVFPTWGQLVGKSKVSVASPKKND